MIHGLNLKKTLEALAAPEAELLLTANGYAGLSHPDHFARNVQRRAFDALQTTDKLEWLGYLNPNSTGGRWRLKTAKKENK